MNSVGDLNVKIDTIFIQFTPCQENLYFCIHVLSIFFRNINHRKLYVEVADEVLYQILLGKKLRVRFLCFVLVV